MDAANIPAKFPVIWAASASGSYVRVIPTTTSDPDAASLDLGWPPATFEALAAGGEPPDGRDANGINQQMTAWLQWAQAGGGAPVYDSVFSAAIGGYFNGSILLRADKAGLWISTADNNTSDPDAGGANWIPFTQVNLTANTTYYVSTTGSDTTGIGSSGNPWQTIQHAWNWVADNVVFHGYLVTIQLAHGTYTAGLGFYPQPANGINVTITGDSSNATAVVIETTNSDAFGASQGMDVEIQYMVLQTIGSGDCVGCINGANFTVGPGITFGACAGRHIVGDTHSIIEISDSYTINGAAVTHWEVNNFATIQCETPVTITLSGTPAFTTFAQAITGSISLPIPPTFSGAATGQRYLATLAGIINTNGSGATYLPGNTAGTATSPGGLRMTAPSQSSPNWPPGYAPTSAEWAAAWAGKFDSPATTALPALVWTNATRPSSPAVGWTGYNSDAGSLEWWTGAAWEFIGGGYVPTKAVLQPSTGFTAVITTTQLFLNPAGTLATGTITLPIDPGDGQMAIFSSVYGITAATIQTTDGTTLLSVPTFVNAGWRYAWCFDQGTNSWYPA